MPATAFWAGMGAKARMGFQVRHVPEMARKGRAVAELETSWEPDL